MNTYFGPSKAILYVWYIALWKQSFDQESVPNLSTQHLNSHLLCILVKRHSTHDFEQVRCVKVHPALKENAMNTNTLLLIVIVLLLLGGGYYGRGRWF